MSCDRRRAVRPAARLATAWWRLLKTNGGPCGEIAAHLGRQTALLCARGRPTESLSTRHIQWLGHLCARWLLCLNTLKQSECAVRSTTPFVVIYCRRYNTPDDHQQSNSSHNTPLPAVLRSLTSSCWPLHATSVFYSAALQYTDRLSYSRHQQVYSSMSHL